MPLSTPQIVAIALFAAANIIFAVSFSHIALIAYSFYVSGKVKPVYIRGTKILLYPLLIAFGGFSFLYSIFTYFLIAWAGIGNVGIDFRFYGTSATFLGMLLAFYGFYKFNKSVKVANVKELQQ